MAHENKAVFPVRVLKSFLLQLVPPMAKPKSNTVRLESKPKTTSIGHGLNSRPNRRGKKRYRGQGK
jgi:hypothetical protein